MKTLTISKAAQQAGVGVETIRFYERKGLIDQPLKPVDGGYRTYPPETIRRLRFIRQAQELGFSLREITELLALRASPDTDCADICQRAGAKLEEVERKISQLKKIGSALQTVIASCPSRSALRQKGQGAHRQKGLDGCSIIEALERPELGNSR